MLAPARRKSRTGAVRINYSIVWRRLFSVFRFLLRGSLLCGLLLSSLGIVGLLCGSLLRRGLLGGSLLLGFALVLLCSGFLRGSLLRCGLLLGSLSVVGLLRGGFLCRSLLSRSLLAGFESLCVVNDELDNLLLEQVSLEQILGYKALDLLNLHAVHLGELLELLLDILGADFDLLVLCYLVESKAELDLRNSLLAHGALESFLVGAHV